MPRTKISIVFLFVFLSCVTTPLAYAATDPELEALRQQQALDAASRRLEVINKQLADLNVANDVYARCGQAPALTPENVGKLWPATNSVFRKWDNCAKTVITAETSRRAFEKRLEGAVDIVKKLDATKNTEQQCGPVPPLPQDKSGNEQEKFEIKTNLWIRCSEKVVEVTKNDLKKSGLFDDVAYIQDRTKEFNLEGKLSDICSATPKFLKLTKDQLTSYADILEIKGWYDCARKNINQLVAEEEYQRKIKVQELENIQKATNEAKKTLEAKTQSEAKLVPAEKLEEKPKPVEALTPEVIQKAETPVVQSSTSTPPSKIRRIFRELARFFRF